MLSPQHQADLSCTQRPSMGRPSETTPSMKAEDTSMGSRSRSLPPPRRARGPSSSDVPAGLSNVATTAMAPSCTRVGSRQRPTLRKSVGPSNRWKRDGEKLCLNRRMFLEPMLLSPGCTLLHAVSREGSSSIYTRPSTLQLHNCSCPSWSGLQRSWRMSRLSPIGFDICCCF